VAGIGCKQRIVVLLRSILVLIGLWAAPAFAATCSQATSQGTAPSSWQTYCWLDFSTYVDATARSASGQNFSFNLSDGAILSFNLKATSTAATAASAIAAPSWTGAAVGNSAFLGIPGSPILYTANGTSTVGFTFSSILITPPPGAPAVTAYAFVAADAESTDNAETMSFTTNGSGWVLLDAVPPISGSQYPVSSGVGSATFSEAGGGNTGNVGGYIVGSNSPTTVSASMTGAGLQGMMFAVRFASIRLNKQISGARIAAADQFTFNINATSTSTVLATGTSTGSGNGPFTAAAVSLASGIPLTVTENMAAGSTNTLAKYQSRLTCINGTSGSSTPVPTNVATTSYSFGTLQFGDAIQCTFTNTAYPHIALTKALGAGGRRFAGDQFTVNIADGATSIASATTSGTGSTVTGGATGLTQVTSGTAYGLSEIAAGGSLSLYTSAMSCTNAATGSTTTLPSTVPGTLTPVLGDVITCILTNTRKPANALLTLAKSSTLVSDPIHGTTNPKVIPGAIIRYSITVTNIGPSAVDLSTTASSNLIVTDPLPTTVTYDASTPVTFTDGSTTSGLSAFNAATMVTYSSQTGGGAPFTYTPTAGYDPNVKGLRIVPLGSMAGATSTSAQPSFTISFLAQVK
jgi:uncharacterized repeat protein (TIGR01451 family)